VALDKLDLEQSLSLKNVEETNGWKNDMQQLPYLWRVTLMKRIIDTSKDKDGLIWFDDPPSGDPAEYMLECYYELRKLIGDGRKSIAEPLEVTLARITKELEERGILPAGNEDHVP
jgi:hypothetical protein